MPIFKGNKMFNELPSALRSTSSYQSIKSLVGMHLTGLPFSKHLVLAPVPCLALSPSLLVVSPSPSFDCLPQLCRKLTTLCMSGARVYQLGCGSLVGGNRWGESVLLPIRAVGTFPLLVVHSFAATHHLSLLC